MKEVAVWLYCASSDNKTLDIIITRVSECVIEDTQNDTQHYPCIYSKLQYVGSGEMLDNVLESSVSFKLELKSGYCLVNLHGYSLVLVSLLSGLESC